MRVSCVSCGCACHASGDVACTWTFRARRHVRVVLVYAATRRCCCSVVLFLCKHAHASPGYPSMCVCVSTSNPLPSQVEYLARCNHCHQAIRDKTWHVYKDLAYHHGCVMRACVSAHACSCLPAVRVRSSQGHSLYGLKDCHAGVSSAQNVDGPRERPSTQTPKKLSSAKLAFDWRSQAALTASRWRQSIQKAHGCGHLCEKIRNTQHPHPPLRSRMSVFRRNLRRPS